jgi:hypothetical protein
MDFLCLSYSSINYKYKKTYISFKNIKQNNIDKIISITIYSTRNQPILMIKLNIIL